MIGECSELAEVADMVEPVSLTGAALMTLAASKFVETAAEKAAAQLGTGVTAAVLKKAGTQVDAMWARVKRHFAGNKKAEGRSHRWRLARQKARSLRQQ